MNAQPCPRCGKQNPADIHTCTPLALKLADALRALHEAKKYHPSGPGGQMCGIEQYRLVTSGLAFEDLQNAAAELRRLHAENEALKSELRMEQTISFRVQMQQYAAQRDALLEALKFVLSATGEQLTTAFEQAEFAIAKATRENV